MGSVVITKLNALVLMLFLMYSIDGTTARRVNCLCKENLKVEENYWKLYQNATLKQIYGYDYEPKDTNFCNDRNKTLSRNMHEKYCYRICECCTKVWQCICRQGFYEPDCCQFDCLDLYETMMTVAVNSYKCQYPQDYAMATDDDKLVKCPAEAKKCPLIVRPSNGDMNCFYDVMMSVNAMRCQFWCKKGYFLRGSPMRICRNGEWDGSDVGCVATFEPFIKCSKEIVTITRTFQNNAIIDIPKPQTNVDWDRDVTAVPKFAKKLKIRLYFGSYTLQFIAKRNYKIASCTIDIIVLDIEPPLVVYCPNDISVMVEHAKDISLVHWKEPLFSDNVGIQSIRRTLAPGYGFRPGNHVISYKTTDTSGNIVYCNFCIDVIVKH